MTPNPFADSLVRKSERALRIARLSLQNGADSAVNRAYHAMFNAVRAALLNSGVPEGELPPTHRGINDAFRQHAVLPGRIDSELASALSRAENLRLRADYTATEIEPEAAVLVVREAEKFVHTVAREFGLSATETRVETSRLSPEEERRQARENWLRFRQQEVEHAKDAAKEPTVDTGKGARPSTSSPQLDEGYGLSDDQE